MKTYYKDHELEIRDSTPSDVITIGDKMRKSDRQEIWKSHHQQPREAVMTGFRESVTSYTATIHGEPILMTGIVPTYFLGSSAVIWMLATDQINEIPVKFVRQSRIIIGKFLEQYPHLYNYVDMKNTESIKWLKWCGAEFGPIINYGIEQKPFRYFQFLRRK